mgnify:CR=1 FL=1
MEQDFSQFENFSAGEFTCQHCGSEGIELDFVQKIQNLRSIYGRGMTISSGYRCPEHPIEARKAEPGAHASGRAVDIAVAGADALLVWQLHRCWHSSKGRLRLTFYTSGRSRQ